MPQLYIVYLDEFGHVGSYISNNDPHHNTHPIFGLGGFVLPAEKVRSFSSFFFKLKHHLFGAYDIAEARKREQWGRDLEPEISNRDRELKYRS